MCWEGCVQFLLLNHRQVYRVWVVCQRKWRIVVLPICCLTGFIGTNHLRIFNLTQPYSDDFAVCMSIFLRIASTPHTIENAPGELLPFGSKGKFSSTFSILMFPRSYQVEKRCRWLHWLVIWCKYATHLYSYTVYNR